MAFYITEAAVANELKDSSSFLITQPESVGDSEPVESLRRVKLDEVRRVIGAEAMEGVRSIISRLENLESAAIGNLFTEVYRTEMGYGDQKEVPEGALEWATVNKIVGKTVAINQINGNSSTSSTYKGVTFTNRGDGYWTASGEMNETNCFKNLRAINTYGLFQFGHKYAIIGNRPNLYIACNGVTNDLLETGYRDGLADRIIEKTNPINASWARLQVPDSMIGKTVNETIFPMIVDLTAMFGKGNEPATIEEVKAILQIGNYPYKLPTLYGVCTQKIASSNSVGTSVDTLDMSDIISKCFPEGMHGCDVHIANGVNTVVHSFHDEIDFDEGMARMRCKAVSLKDHTAWTAVDGEEPNHANRFTTNARAVSGAFSGEWIFSPNFPETVGYDVVPTMAGQIGMNVDENYFGQITVCVSRELTGITDDESADGKLSKFLAWAENNDLQVVYRVRDIVKIEIGSVNHHVKVSGGGSVKSMSVLNSMYYDIPVQTDGKIPVRIAR